MVDDPAGTGSPTSERRFATTHWSVVLSAAEQTSPASEAALATLCETYWYPIYAFVRRKGYDSAQAEDLAQAFFLRLLEKNSLQAVRRERGKFRSFLLASLKNFIFNEWDRAKAAKRGGGRRVISIDFNAADSRYRLEPSHDQTPEAIFDKQWALTLLDRVQTALRHEFAEAGKLAQFDRLRSYLIGDKDSIAYREVAKELNMSEGAVRVAVHRLRKQFREALRHEIAHTVADEDVIDDEIRDLFDVLRS